MRLLKRRGQLAAEDQEPDSTETLWLINAYYELSTARPSGMGPCSIPITTLFTYADRYELGDDFIRTMQRVDSLIVRQSLEATADG